MRLTAAQALVRWLAAQEVVGSGPDAGAAVPFFGGVWAIFGHGNVAALGEALERADPARLPTYRAHSEQGMAHAAIGFARAHARRRAMVCTTSIGPGATNMVTAAALAHANRLPVLFLPSDVYASRRPDPVLQQIEHFADATVSANDCFRPVSRLFDRITRPEQLLDALPRAMAILTDPAACGPVTLALCQDVQAEAIDWPEDFLAPRLWTIRRPPPDARELAALADALRGAKRPLLIAGGGVFYAGAASALAALAAATGIPVAETQAGKGALPAHAPQALGAIGVTGTSAANAAAREADVIVGLGTRLQDFTTGSRRLFAGDARLFQVNVALHDVAKHGAAPVLGDAGVVVDALAAALQGWAAPGDWAGHTTGLAQGWRAAARAALEQPVPHGALPDDVAVIGAVQRARPDATIVGAAGGLPGDLHRFWPCGAAGRYHVEYGFSCMGYEIAGGLGIAMADRAADVVVMVGDGSYLMLNSELATAAALGVAFTVVLLDNRGFGCIHRLQGKTGNASFATLRGGDIDFVAHARALGAAAHKVADCAALEQALRAPRVAGRPTVLVIETDPDGGRDLGGVWWDVAVPEVSSRTAVRTARAAYDGEVELRR